MTHTQDDHSLSPMEQAVLARLSCPKPPRPAELIKDIAEIAAIDPPEPPSAAIEVALATLRRRKWVVDAQLKLTSAGTTALRQSFDLKRAPTWNQYRARLAASALGLTLGTEQAKKVLNTKDSIALAVLRQRGPLPHGATMNAVCDALVAERLGLPAGKLTLARIRAHVLARRIDMDSPDEPLAVAAAVIDARSTKKPALLEALARRGYAVRSRQDTSHRPVNGVPGDQALLALVRDTMARVGPDGRVGAERVFVSAIWHRIVTDGRTLALSLETFKRWLVSANRDQLLALERADAVGAMDPRLVAESEIKSLGTTFHFVIDQRDDGSQVEL